MGGSGILIATRFFNPQSVYAKTSLNGTMECYHQSTAVDVYARHSQEGWSMNIIICACLA